MHTSAYPFEFRANCKGRWIGQCLLDVLEREFRTSSREHHLWNIQNEHVRVNGAIASPSLVLQSGDKLSYKIHRHEPPVTDEPIEIVHCDSQLLVINKPASIPVHPSGLYFYHSAIRILQNMGYSNLHAINRLDRLTSGLCMFGRNSATASAMMNAMKERSVQKVYIARVKGEFPSQVECHEPIETSTYKTVINFVSPNGKECSTLFKRRSFNGRTSVVECRPKTGRTHQIRVHLQYLGYPIANDPIYCNSGWGKDLGKGGIPSDEINPVIDSVILQAFPDPRLQVGDYTKGCIECQIKRREPCAEQLLIYLHSWRYIGDGWQFETRLPAWADESFDDSALETRFWNFGGVWDGIAEGTFIERR